jgi:hypothetical protein
MNRYRYISWPVYLVAAMLVLLPVAEFVISVWPIQASVVRWRFGAVGLFSGALMVPILGIFIAYAAALLLEHRAVQRAISVLSGVMVLVLVVAAAGFVLDALQMRGQVRSEALRAFDAASAMGLAKMSLAMFTMLSLSVSGWRSARVGAPEKRARKNRVTAPVMARPAAESAAVESAPSASA